LQYNQRTRLTEDGGDSPGGEITGAVGHGPTGVGRRAGEIEICADNSSADQRWKTGIKVE
jgi:hypothetical protein